jgi:hypothetical protein
MQRQRRGPLRLQDTSGNEGPASEALSLEEGDQPSSADAIWKRISDQGQDAYDRATGAFEFALDSVFDLDTEELINSFLNKVELDTEVQRVDNSATQKIGDLEATLVDEYVLITAQEAAIAQAKTAVETKISDDITANVGSISTALSSPTGAMANLDLSINATFGGLEDELDSLDDDLGALAGTVASINNSYLAETDLESALAVSALNVSTTLGGLTTTVDTVDTSVDGIKALHGVKINNNGTPAGYYLNSELLNGVAASDMVFDVDNFYVGTSNSSGDYDPVFSISGGVTYLQKARIKEADIDTLKIAGNAVTIPTSGTSSKVFGSGSYQSLVTIAINLPVQSDVLLFWSLNQGYENTVPIWGYELKDPVSGVLYDTREGTFGIDQPSGQYLLLDQSSGTFRAQLGWKGGSSDISAIGSLTVLVVMR